MIRLASAFVAARRAWPTPHGQRSAADRCPPAIGLCAAASMLAATLSFLLVPPGGKAASAAHPAAVPVEHPLQGETVAAVAWPLIHWNLHEGGVQGSRALSPQWALGDEVQVRDPRANLHRARQGRAIRTNTADRKERRDTSAPGDRVRLTLRYTACGGLMNQYYCHVAALTLAHLTRARRVIWPPVLERESYRNLFSHRARVNQQKWKFVNASTIFDVDAIGRAMREQFNIEVVQHPAEALAPEVTNPSRAFQLYPPHDAAYDRVLQFQERLFTASRKPLALARAIRDLSLQGVAEGGQGEGSTVLVDLPCTLFMLDVRRLPVVEEVAAAVAFAPQMLALAQTVLQSLHERFQRPFNGVHLRLERDAMDWILAEGGPGRWWAMYERTMQTAGFNRTSPLYVASALVKAQLDQASGAMAGEGGEHEHGRGRRLHHEAEAGKPGTVVKKLKAGIGRAERLLLRHKLAHEVVYKEMFLSEDQLRGLGNEQAALVDLLVLRRAQEFVGVAVSTFSFALNEMRLLDGYPPNSSHLMQAPRVGTDELFHSCALLAVKSRAMWKEKGMLRNQCRKPTGAECFE